MTIDYEKHTEYLRPNTIEADDTYPMMTITIYLDKHINLLEIAPNIDEIIDIIKDNCTMWDLEYGISDIYISVFKIKNFNNCKKEIEKISKINNFNIEKLKLNYYD